MFVQESVNIRIEIPPNMLVLTTSSVIKFDIRGPYIQASEQPHPAKLWIYGLVIFFISKWLNEWQW